jgi:hypothetical protein
MARLKERLRAARTRARKKNLFFTLSLDLLLEAWAKQEGKCFYTGTAMTTDGGAPECVSIDRVTPSAGYVGENIVLCCWAVNRMKDDMTVEQLRCWCERVVSHG